MMKFVILSVSMCVVYVRSLYLEEGSVDVMEHKCITFFRQRVIIRTKQAIIKMNYSTTRGSGFKSRYTNTIFLKNNQSLIRVHFPIATASEASDTDFVSIRMESMRFAGNDFAVPKAPSPQQYPFYLVRFYSSTNIQIPFLERSLVYLCLEWI